MSNYIGSPYRSGLLFMWCLIKFLPGIGIIDPLTLSRTCNIRKSLSHFKQSYHFSKLYHKKMMWVLNVCPVPVLCPHWRKTDSIQRSRSHQLLSVLLKAGSTHNLFTHTQFISSLLKWSCPLLWACRSPHARLYTPRSSPPDPPHPRKGPVSHPVPPLLCLRSSMQTCWAWRPRGLQTTALRPPQTL